MTVLGLRLRKARETAVQPPLRQRQRLGRIVARGIPRRALVEGHHYVGADRTFGVDHILGREQMARAVYVRTEVASLLLELAALRQREDLKAAAVGEHRPLPCRETVHATRLLHDAHTRAQVEMVGVGQNDARTGIVPQVAVEDALHCGGRAYGHEYGGLDGTVIGLHQAGSCLRCGSRMLKRKFHFTVVATIAHAYVGA